MESLVRLGVSGLLLAVALRADATPHSADTPCVMTIRAGGPNDQRLVDRNPLLGEPPNWNDAPGPGSLRALVRSDSLHHPHIFVVDVVRATSRLLCAGSAPRWSPDGKWIAYTAWFSQRRWHVLRLIDPTSGKASTVEIDQIADYAWSPDGSKLAFTVMQQSPFEWQVGWVDIRRGAQHVIATDNSVYTEYGGLAWAPDSRRFIANASAENEHDDSVRSSDLWLYDVTGRRCRLTNTPREEEMEAGWIDNQSIRFSLINEHSAADTLATIQRVIGLRQ